MKLTKMSDRELLEFVVKNDIGPSKAIGTIIMDWYVNDYIHYSKWRKFWAKTKLFASIGLLYLLIVTPFSYIFR